MDIDVDADVDVHVNVDVDVLDDVDVDVDMDVDVDEGILKFCLVLSTFLKRPPTQGIFSTQDFVPSSIGFHAG